VVSPIFQRKVGGEGLNSEPSPTMAGTAAKDQPTVSCYVGHTGTRLITKVKQRWARSVLDG
jgi:hypothetical protein